MAILELPDGSRQILYLSLDGTYFITASRYRADCGSAGLVVTAPDGMRYEMNTPGQAVPVDGCRITPPNPATRHA